MPRRAGRLCKQGTWPPLCPGRLQSVPAGEREGPRVFTDIGSFSMEVESIPDHNELCTNSTLLVGIAVRSLHEQILNHPTCALSAVGQDIGSTPGWRGSSSSKEKARSKREGLHVYSGVPWSSGGPVGLIPERDWALRVARQSLVVTVLCFQPPALWPDQHTARHGAVSPVQPGRKVRAAAPGDGGPVGRAGTIPAPSPSCTFPSPCHKSPSPVLLLCLSKSRTEGSVFCLGLAQIEQDAPGTLHYQLPRSCFSVTFHYFKRQQLVTEGPPA